MIGPCFDFKKKLTYTAQNQERDGHAARRKPVARVMYGFRHTLQFSVLHFPLRWAPFSAVCCDSGSCFSVEVHGSLFRIQDFVLPGEVRLLSTALELPNQGSLSPCNFTTLLTISVFTVST